MDFNGDGGPREILSENACDTRDAPPAPSASHDPRDEPWWLDRFRSAGSSGEVNDVVVEWARSVGGATSVTGETLTASVPTAFEDSTIARLAYRHGWKIRPFEPGARH